MSGDRRDEPRSSRGTNPNDRRLPPIREVFRDELDRPARPDPYAFGGVRGALPATQSAPWGYSGPGRNEQRRSTGLPPIQDLSPYGSSHVATDTRTSSAQRRYSSQAPSPSPSQSRGGRDHVRGTEDPGYSYGVLRASGTSGEFVNAIPPSYQPQGILRQTAAPAREDHEDLSKRYKCDYCGKRFGMPSHLQIHIRTHTAQRPFACEWPGCDRTFSVRSNMMRHYRSHGTPSGSHHQLQERSRDDDEEDDIGEDQYSREGASASSQYFHRTSSSNHQSSSQYYSSSRRK